MIAVVQKRRLGHGWFQKFLEQPAVGVVYAVFFVSGQVLFGPSSCSGKYWVNFNYKDGTELGAGEVFRVTITVLTWAC